MAPIAGDVKPENPGRRRRRVFWLSIGSAILALGVVVAASEIRDSLAFADEKIDLDGVENFGRLNQHVYRGAQPRIDAYASLRAMGIDTVVRLSTGEEFIAGEKERVEALGMRFISIPWRAADTPTAEQVSTFLNLFREQPTHTIFVHCREGVDRTGVMMALYRIAIDHFSVDRAIDEMKAFHYRYIFHPHLEEYVTAFAADSQ